MKKLAKVKINQSSNQGITLIALVVTIIIILVISGVSINLLLGDNGIITNATNAKKQAKIVQIQDQVDSLIDEYQINYYQGTETVTIANYVQTNLNGKQVSGYDIVAQGNKIKLSKGTDTFSGRILEDGSIDWTKRWELEKDESGEFIVTDGTTVLKVGDYVNYDPIKGATTKTVTSYATENGNSDQTFELESLDVKTGAGWRVLGASESGEILLVSDTTIAPTENSSGFTLQGQDGYKNGIDELNKICAMYGQGKYATGARSINVDDVNSLTGFDPTSYSGYGVQWTYSRNGTSTLNYSTSDGQSGSTTKSTFNYFDESTKTWKEFDSTKTGSVKLTSTDYWYVASSKLSQTSLAYKTLFEKNENESAVRRTSGNLYLYYWLGSSYVHTYSSYAYFGLRYVYSGSVSRDILCNSDVDSNYRYCGVRPVVSLKSDINLKYGTLSGEWKITD